MKKKLVVLSGAGVSAESGVKTFRDHNGLWENYRIEDVASPEGFRRNPQLVLDFYNQRRRQLTEVSPNSAHILLQKLEQKFDVHIITQNVDDLHERAGSKKVLHLHGELIKARPVNASAPLVSWEGDLNWGDLNENGIQMRPLIVWFGEAVDKMGEAIDIVAAADLFLVIGTSMSVYPAAALIDYIPDYCRVFIIDPALNVEHYKAEKYYKAPATTGMKMLVDYLFE